MSIAFVAIVESYLCVLYRQFERPTPRQMGTTGDIDVQHIAVASEVCHLLPTWFSLTCYYS
jgi:hypothetical protein